MTFLAPAVLAGLGTMTLPVAIHLLNRMRVRTITWGATRFLLESVKKNQRRLQIEDLILLLLRCLLIGLLALAFARPVINPETSAAGVADGPETTVLVLDQSASMGQSNGIETRYELAKTGIRKKLDEMGRGSQAALFLVTDRVTQVVARPTSNLALVRRAVDVSKPSDRTSDLLPAIQMAVEALKPFPGRKRILIFTDNQKTAWEQLPAIRALVAGLPGISLQLESLGENGEDNVAITSIKPESLLCAAGQLFGASVTIANFGATPVNGVRVTLAMNDDSPADESVIERIEPGKSQSVRLNARFKRAGFQTLKAAIPPDRLPVDNERVIAVQVIDQVRVAIVEGNPAAPKADRDAFYLTNGLAPISSGRATDFYLQSEAVPTAWIETADLTRYEVIFLSNAPAPNASASQKLRQYVANGGALVVFPGPNVRPEDYNSERALGDILPAKIGALREPGKNATFATWQAKGYPHPVTALWNDGANGSLATVRATKYFPLTPVAPAGKNDNDSPHVMVSYSDGTAAVVERGFKKGHVVLFGSTATPQWNTLPIHPNFVPLLQRLIGYITNRATSDSLTLSPGGVFQQNVDSTLAGREFSVISPNARGKARSGGRVEMLDQSAVARYSDTENTGAYQLLFSGNDIPFATCAVQMDARESDLRTAAVADLARVVRPSMGLAGKQSAGKRLELWGPLLVAAAIIALLEMTLAHRFSVAK